MQALEPRINVLSLDHQHINTKYDKLKFLLTLPETLRKELWKGDPDVYADIEGIMDYNRGKRFLPPSVRDRMEHLLSRATYAMRQHSQAIEERLICAAGRRRCSCYSIATIRMNTTLRQVLICGSQMRSKQKRS
jgi:hypothetical protein